MENDKYIDTLALSYDPNFLILDTEIKDEFIFYNSVRHFGCRINKLELLLLNIFYKYANIDYVVSQFPPERQTSIRGILERLSEGNILSIEEESTTEADKNLMQKKKTLQTFYLHLTYKCNLHCSYCYNKDIRKQQKEELSLDEWKDIIDKIANSATLIILTGGECLLYPEIVPLLKYIRQKCINTTISCISNCMHDFSKGAVAEALNYLNDITFSCDSIKQEGERKGFNPQLFCKNIEYLKQHKPQLQIFLSATLTNKNKEDIIDIQQFCTDTQCNLMRIIINPCTYNDIEMLPSISEYLKEEDINQGDCTERKRTYLLGKRVRCGAAKSTCSIDPKGNVYPCQNLHYSEFFMGNILKQEVKDLRYQDEEECIPHIDTILECAKCKVKYICGGGCPASLYALEKGKLGRNRLLCPYNYRIAINTLKDIENKPPKETTI